MATTSLRHHGRPDAGLGRRAERRHARQQLSAAARLGYTAVAMSTWQPYIDRLTRHVAEAEGVNTYGGTA